MDAKISLRGYNDSDWGSDPAEMRSTSGSCIFSGSNLMAWSSKKQTLVARSVQSIKV